MNTWKEKFREKFVSKRKHPYLGYTKEIVYSKAEDIEAFITNALNQQRERLVERIEKHMEPAFKDLSGAGDIMIAHKLPNAGREMHETVGYMKGIFHTLKEEK